MALAAFVHIKGIFYERHKMTEIGPNGPSRLSSGKSRLPPPRIIEIKGVMPQITSLIEFGQWYRAGKPARWMQALALRSALRVLPLALDPANFRDLTALAILTGAVCRANAISWAAAQIPAHEMALRAARTAIYFVDAAADAAADADELVPGGSAALAARAANAADTADAAASAARAAADAAYAAYAARGTYAASYADAAIWKALSADCEWLERQASRNDAIGLLARPLWPAGDNPLAEEWQNARGDLLSKGLSLWADWYQRRLDGQATGFALPAAADREIAGRLLSAEDEWWTGGEKEPGLEQFQRVTRDIESWIAELGPPGGDDDAIGEALKRNYPETLYYRETENQRLGLDREAKRLQMATDAATQRRWEELQRFAKRLHDRCQSENFGNKPTEIREDAEFFWESAQVDLNQIEPDIFVARANALLIAIAANREALSGANSDREGRELPAAIWDALRQLESPLQIFMDLDQLLALLRDAGKMLDEPVDTVIEGRAVIAEADEAGILEPEVLPTLRNVLDNAPPTPDPANPESVREAKEQKHFARRALSMAWGAMKTVGKPIDWTVKQSANLERIGGWVKFVWNKREWFAAQFQPGSPARQLLDKLFSNGPPDLPLM
jgi:hypothetical protein